MQAIARLARADARQMHGRASAVLGHSGEFVLFFLISAGAPLAAIFLHSFLVIHRGYQLYNAEIGGIYFWDHWENQHVPISLVLISALEASVLAAGPTGAVLFPFRKRPLFRRLAWVGSVAAWLFFLFQNEFARK